MITVDLRHISVKKNRVIRFGKSGAGSQLWAGTSVGAGFGQGFETGLRFRSGRDNARPAAPDLPPGSATGVGRDGVEPVTNREPGKNQLPIHNGKEATIAAISHIRRSL